MTDSIRDSQGERIRALLRQTGEEVAIIAPFIKVGALKSLLDVIEPTVFVRCVTRWLPSDIAAGVSDPEIFGLLAERGNFSLSLVDNLHAKLYIAGEKCLVGSANVTYPGLGEGNRENNIEVLVLATTSDPGVVSTLEAIASVQRPAKPSDATAARILADCLGQLAQPARPTVIGWMPHSRKPEAAYAFYSQPPIGFLGAADRILLADVASADLPPGLTESEFRACIRTLLSNLPLARPLLDSTQDALLTLADALPQLEPMEDSDCSAVDLWQAFANWMAHFYSESVILQPVMQIALRRAQKLC